MKVSQRKIKFTPEVIAYGEKYLAHLNYDLGDFLDLQRKVKIAMRGVASIRYLNPAKPLPLAADGKWLIHGCG